MSSKRNRGKQPSLPGSSTTISRSMPAGPTGPTLIAQQQEFSGPLPHPSILHQYNQVLPNAAERVFQMAEREQAHRHNRENENDRAENIRGYLGMIFAVVLALICVGSSTYLAFHGQRAVPIAIATTTIIGLVAAFLKGSAEKSDKDQSSAGAGHIPVEIEGEGNASKGPFQA